MTTFEKGDLVEIEWLDITEDPVGDTDKAKCDRRRTFACYWETKVQDGHEVIVTTTTLDDTPAQQGWCCYPKAILVHMALVKRKRKRRNKRANQPT